MTVITVFDIILILYSSKYFLRHQEPETSYMTLYTTD